MTTLSKLLSKVPDSAIWVRRLYEDPLAEANWDESKHKRDHGKFSDGRAAIEKMRSEVPLHRKFSNYKDAAEHAQSMSSAAKDQVTHKVASRAHLHAAEHAKRKALVTTGRAGKELWAAAEMHKRKAAFHKQLHPNIESLAETFDESKHPRNKGKFSKKGAGSKRTLEVIDAKESWRGIDAHEVARKIMADPKYHDGRAYMVKAGGFGKLAIIGYRNPSAISHRDIGQSHMGMREGYWQNGKFKEHSAKKKIKYENWGLGVESLVEKAATFAMPAAPSIGKGRFDETKHKRDHGKFSSTGGASGPSGGGGQAAGAKGKKLSVADEEGNFPTSGHEFTDKLLSKLKELDVVDPHDHSRTVSVLKDQVARQQHKGFPEAKVFQRALDHVQSLGPGGGGAKAAGSGGGEDSVSRQIKAGVPMGQLKSPGAGQNLKPQSGGDGGKESKADIPPTGKRSSGAPSPGASASSGQGGKKPSFERLVGRHVGRVLGNAKAGLRLAHAGYQAATKHLGAFAQQIQRHAQGAEHYDAVQGRAAKAFAASAGVGQANTHAGRLKAHAEAYHAHRRAALALQHSNDEKSAATHLAMAKQHAGLHRETLGFVKAIKAKKEGVAQRRAARMEKRFAAVSDLAHGAIANAKARASGGGAKPKKEAKPTLGLNSTQKVDAAQKPKAKVAAKQPKAKRQTLADDPLRSKRGTKGKGGVAFLPKAFLAGTSRQRGGSKKKGKRMKTKESLLDPAARIAEGMKGVIEGSYDEAKHMRDSAGRFSHGKGFNYSGRAKNFSEYAAKLHPSDHKLKMHAHRDAAEAHMAAHVHHSDLSTYHRSRGEHETAEDHAKLAKKHGAKSARHRAEGNRYAIKLKIRGAKEDTKESLLDPAAQIAEGMGRYDESKHKRDEGGKFSSTGSGGGGGEKKLTKKGLAAKLGKKVALMHSVLKATYPRATSKRSVHAYEAKKWKEYAEHATALAGQQEPGSQRHEFLTDLAGKAHSRKLHHEKEMKTYAAPRTKERKERKALKAKAEKLDTAHKGDMTERSRDEHVASYHAHKAAAAAYPKGHADRRYHDYAVKRIKGHLDYLRQIGESLSTDPASQIAEGMAAHGVGPLAESGSDRPEGWRG